MNVRLLHLRDARRSVLLIALPRWPNLAWASRLLRWLSEAPAGSPADGRPVWPLPPYIRDDLGLPPDPLPRDWRGRPHHPTDLSQLHRWR